MSTHIPVQPHSLADAAGEAVHLRDTIIRMREEMERLGLEKQRGIQEAMSAGNIENQQLRNTVQALRDEMESMKLRFEQEVQAIRTAEREAQKQLHAVILELRDQLEQH